MKMTEIMVPMTNRKFSNASPPGDVASSRRASTIIVNPTVPLNHFPKQLREKDKETKEAQKEAHMMLENMTTPKGIIFDLPTGK